MHHKGTQPLRYLGAAPYAEDPGPLSLLAFPRFDPNDSPKAVALTGVETLLHLSNAGFWMQPEDLPNFLAVLGTVPALALRHNGEIGATRTLLAQHGPCLRGAA